MTDPVGQQAESLHHLSDTGNESMALYPRDMFA